MEIVRRYSFWSFQLFVMIFQMSLVFPFSSPALGQDKNSGNAAWVKHPVYEPGISDLNSLKNMVEPLMRMSVNEVIAQVPSASGINFVGCPNCDGGAQENGVLGWKLGMGDQVQCNYCKMVFPNEKFPNNSETVITAPSGVKQVYRYYKSASGREYYFEPHAWYERWIWINSKASELAKLYYATGDNAYGDRAAAIAGRFAKVFPDYAVRYDYPNTPVKFYPADQKWPYVGVAPYRGAKWRWWGYDDIPTDLMEVYDLLMAKYDWKRMDKVIGPGTEKRIANDLLRLGYEFTTANPEMYSNKSPGMYSNMIRAGRVLGDPAMVHEAVKRFREFFSKGFFPDGWWKEGTTSYHRMTINGLRTVANALAGYVDPVDWKGERFNNPDLTVEIPLYKKALEVSNDALLPNGRDLPINDTWGLSQKKKTNFTESKLWPALGNASLRSGKGKDQVMLNVNWSGNYGHSHYDNGSIILFAAGEELLSDIGYTHTKYRGWTIQTASHNTVVIDQKGQDTGTPEKPVTGHLQFYDDKDTHVKVVDVDASPAYGKAKAYRRRLVMVNAAPGRDYVVDRFDVEGGKDHDWFLHGMCEQQGTLETSIPLNQPVGTLVPAWGGNNMPKIQQDTDEKRFHPYVYLKDIKSGDASEQWSATWKYNGSGLRTHILSQAGTQVFRFHSPSVRLAREDANKLDDFQLNGLLQRHSGSASTFLAVHEPFTDNPWIESVHNDGKALIIRYRLNGKPVEDRLVLNNDGEVHVSSTAGWNYKSGTATSGQVKALETVNGKWRLQLDRDAPGVQYIRLDLSAGVTRYYPVKSVNGKWLDLVDDPGFTMEAGTGRVVFHSFPQEEYAGPLRYTLFEK